MGENILPVHLECPIPGFIPCPSPEPTLIGLVDFVPESFFDGSGLGVNPPVPANPPVVHLANSIGIGQFVTVSNRTRFHESHSIS